MGIPLALKNMAQATIPEAEKRLQHAEVGLRTAQITGYAKAALHIYRARLFHAKWELRQWQKLAEDKSR